MQEIHRYSEEEKRPGGQYIKCHPFPIECAYTPKITCSKEPTSTIIYTYEFYCVMWKLTILDRNSAGTKGPGSQIFQ